MNFDRIYNWRFDVMHCMRLKQQRICFEYQMNVFFRFTRSDHYILFTMREMGDRLWVLIVHFKNVVRSISIAHVRSFNGYWPFNAQAHIQFTQLSTLGYFYAWILIYALLAWDGTMRCEHTRFLSYILWNVLTVFGISIWDWAYQVRPCNGCEPACRINVQRESPNSFFNTSRCQTHFSVFWKENLILASEANCMISMLETVQMYCSNSKHQIIEIDQNSTFEKQIWKSLSMHTRSSFGLNFKLKCWSSHHRMPHTWEFIYLIHFKSQNLFTDNG